MLEILTTLITEAVKKTVDNSVDLATKKLSEKSSYAIKLLTLYSSMLEVEEVSQDFIKEFDDILLGKQILRMRIKHLSDSLNRSVKKLSESFDSVKVVLSVYDTECFDEIVRIRAEKLGYVSTSDSFVSCCPSSLTYDGKAGETIKFCMPRPNRKLAFLGPFTGAERCGNLLETRKIPHFDGEIEVRELRIFPKAASDLHEVIKQARIDVDKLSDSRKKLAEFMRKEIPLDKILFYNNS